jgi:hypothetical protein
MYPATVVDSCGREVCVVSAHAHEGSHWGCNTGFFGNHLAIVVGSCGRQVCVVSAGLRWGATSGVGFKNESM